MSGGITNGMSVEMYTWQEMDDPFYLVDMGRLMDLYQKWVEVLPAVKPFYAIKSNPDPALLNMLGALGTGFDCASKVCTFYQSCFLDCTIVLQLCYGQLTGICRTVTTG